MSLHEYKLEAVRESFEPSLMGWKEFVDFGGNGLTAYPRRSAEVHQACLVVQRGHLLLIKGGYGDGP